VKQPDNAKVEPFTQIGERHDNFISFLQNLGYNSSKQTETTEVPRGPSEFIVVETKRSSKGLQLGSGFVRFGLSVYS
jgi:hypothetical protein